MYVKTRGCQDGQPSRLSRRALFCKLLWDVDDMWHFAQALVSQFRAFWHRLAKMDDCIDQLRWPLPAPQVAEHSMLPDILLPRRLVTIAFSTKWVEFP